jgi:polyisoprenoid-binding protein YceI
VTEATNQPHGRRILVRTGSLAALAVSAVTFVGPSLAAETYIIDRDHVSVNFTMQHDVWAKYQGTIRTIAGTILFDKADVAKSSVQVEMAAASVDTLDLGRDHELQGYGFLMVRKNPKITFESTSVEKTGEKTGKIVGNFTMAGVTKPVSLDVIFYGEGVSQWDGLMRVGFSATGVLNTSDFMKGLIPLNIGPELAFTIEVEATRK